MMKQKTQLGQFKKKREDTLIKTVEKKYGVNFGVRGDMKLGTYLEKEGFPSLSKALKKIQEKESL